MIVHRHALAFLLLLSTACSVDVTVGYNTGAILGGVSCETDALARCEQDACTTTNLFDAPAGAITLAADDTDLFFQSSQLTIGRRALEGGPSVELAAADTTLMGMTSDATHVYWIELNGALRGIAKAGGARFEASYVFGNPTDITLDATHLYWVFPESGQVAMAAKPIGEASHISGQAAPQAITTDATHVYWVNAGTGTATGQLMRAARGDLTTAELLLSGLDAPVAIAASDDAVYWASKTAVFRVAKGGTIAETVATGLTEVKRIAVHGSTVYGIGMDGLWKIGALGGARVTLHASPMSALAIACSGVYASHWLESGLLRYGP